MIARCWRGWTVATDADAYMCYMRETGIAEMDATPGNLGSMVLRQLNHGRAEFLLISLWSSWDSIERFAGADVDRAVFYPEDERFLVSKDHHVNHFEVAHAYFSRLPLNDD